MTVESPKITDVRFAAMGLLARREHAYAELCEKLARRFAEQGMIHEAVSQLRAEGLQSDERFGEAFVAMRIRQGKGPVRIRLELKTRGLAAELIDQVLDAQDDAWALLAGETRVRRFGQGVAGLGASERARQMRFLQYRGFTSEQIRRALTD